MTSREERLAENEARFRSVNEELRERWKDLDVDARRAVFICECADRTCTAVLQMALDEYEAVRASPDTYAIVPGHEDGPTERIVTEEVCETSDGRFAVVEKRSEHRETTEAFDPRT